MANTTVYHPKKQKLYDAASEKSMNHIGKVLSKARNNKGLSLVKFSAVLKDYGVSATASAALIYSIYQPLSMDFAFILVG